MEAMRPHLVPAQFEEQRCWRRDFAHVHPRVCLDGESWTSVYGPSPGDPAVESTADSKPLALEVAEKVLKELDGDDRAHLLFAVADPLAPLVTVALWADVDVCSDRVISALLSGFQRAVQSFESKLAVRPGLQVVFVGDDDVRRGELYTVVQGALRRIGSFAPDFDVRWVRFSDTWIEPALRAHGPDATRLVAASTGRLAPGELSQFVPVAQALSERAPTTPADWIGVGVRLREMLDHFPVPPQTGMTESFGQDTASAPLSLVLARIAVRKFSPRHTEHQPSSLDISMSPVTFVSSENASGKTTLVEALCQLYQKRPRLRFRLPADSDGWGSDRYALPFIAGLRLVAGARAPSPAATLFLFGDDADLRDGSVGESAAMAWWPLAHPSRDEVIAGLTALGDLLRAADRWTGDRERRIDRRVTIPADAGDDLVLGTTLSARVVSALRTVEDDLTIVPPVLAGAASRLATDGRIGLHLLADVAWPAIADELLEAGPTRGTWSTIEELGTILAQRPDRLLPVVQTLFARTVDQLGARFDRLARSLEDLVVTRSGEQLERAFAEYLDPDLESENLARPNTSRLVRKGMARRLARWAGAGGAAPALVIDEPVFGHDPPAAARVLIRLLRLRRRQESVRWFEHVALGCGSGLSVVADDERPAGAARRGAPRVIAGPALVVAPVPVQLVVASHQPFALEVAAELEGVELDYDLRRSVRALIPESWRKPVRDELRACRSRCAQALDAETLLDDAPRALPAQVLRGLWRDPDQLPPLDSGDLKDAWESLGKLGLRHLAATVERDAVERDATFTGRRLLTWLVWNDLLPVAFDAVESGLDLGGVSLRELPADQGPALEIGPTRLRRIGALLEVLPPGAAAGVSSGDGSGSNAPGRDPAVQPVATTTASMEVQDPAVPASAAEPVTGLPSTAAVLDLARAASSLLPPPAQTPPPLRSEPSLGVWRVAILTSNRLAREEIPRSAGTLPCRPGGEADLLVYLVESETVLRYHEAGGLFAGETRHDQWNDGAPLAREIAYQRAEHLARQLPEEQTVDLVVWTYGDDPEPSPTVAFSVGAPVPSDVEVTDLERRVGEAWGARIEAPLVRLRDALGRSTKTRWLKVWPLCTPGTAIRIGALFHHQSRFSVVCDQAGSEWDLDRQPTPSAKAPALSIMPAGPDQDDRDEVHLVIGLTAAVYDRYREWRGGATGIPPARTLAVEPAGGPSRTSVPADQVVDWAEYVFRTVRPLISAVRAGRSPGKAGPPVDLRIFCAAPAAFAIALGRSLNAAGRIVTMDLLRGADGYVATFDFQA